MIVLNQQNIWNNLKDKAWMDYESCGSDGERSHMHRTGFAAYAGGDTCKMSIHPQGGSHHQKIVRNPDQRQPGQPGSSISPIYKHYGC